VLIRVLDNSILRRVIILVIVLFMLYECHRKIVLGYRVYLWPSVFPSQFYELVSQISDVSIIILQLFASLGASFAYVYESNEVVLLFSVRNKRYRILLRVILFDTVLIVILSTIVGFLSFLIAYPEMSLEKPLTIVLFTLIYMLTILLAFIPSYAIGMTLAILTRSLGVSLILSVFLSYILFVRVHAVVDALTYLLSMPRIYVLKPILNSIYPAVLILATVDIKGPIVLLSVSMLLLVFDLLCVEWRDIL